MENLEKVVIGLLLFITTSILAYLFRMRQLYATAPKLFRHAPVSKNGSLCELIVYNNGNQVEESIQVDLDPELKSELLASSSSDITLDGTTMKIERLHKGCEASAILLVENGLLDTTKIVSVSSKGTKGTVRKANDVPPNFAKAFLATVVIVGALPSFIYGMKLFEKIYDEYAEYKLQPSYRQGWSNLLRYYTPDIRKSYGDQEFPIRLIRRETNSNKKEVLVFEVYNKTATILEITANKPVHDLHDITNFAAVNVEPMSKQTFSVLEPESTKESGNPELAFTMKHGEEFIYGLIFALPPK